MYFQEQLRRLERDKAAKISQLEEEFAHLLHLKEEQAKKIRVLEEEKKKWEKKFSLIEKKFEECNKEAQFLKEAFHSH